MNFFKEQEEARKRIKRFKFTFFFVVILTTLITSGFLSVFSGFSQRRYETDSATLFPLVFLGTLTFIFSMSWFKRWSLREGGPKIAQMVGGEPLTSNKSSLPYQRLQNTVEEMSIAAGIVPPKVYILPRESHINAFAAGFNSHDSVIAVSQGCLDKLNRDELQGVVAHEIGHIINGDMKLNLELIGYLHGLMGISYIGRSMMRGRSSRDNKSNAALLGIGLYLIGLVGYFFGLLLKFSISRGQEYHADAKAVQLSRNPDGIGGALKKILALEQEFKIHAPKSSEISHLYFFYPDSSSFFSTHPPLENRIKKILPSFKFSEYSVKEKPGFVKLMRASDSNEFIKSFSSTTPEPTLMPNARELEEDALLLFDRISSGEVKKVTRFQHLTLDETLVEMDLNIGRLKNLPDEERRSILENCREVILEDKRIIAREILCFTLYKECLTTRTKLPISRSISQKANEIEIVLSFLSTLGPADEGLRQKAREAGWSELFPKRALSVNPRMNVKTVMDSLEALRDLRPFDKEKFLRASKTVIAFDQLASSDEKIFLKVLSQILDVPITEV